MNIDEVNMIKYSKKNQIFMVDDILDVDVMGIDYDQIIIMAFGILETIGFEQDPYELIDCLKPSIVKM